MKVLFWHRRDLRVDDNAGLEVATTLGKVVPVFIFDTNILSELKPEDKRVTFIYKQIERLKGLYKQFGTDLIVKFGDPKELIPQLADELNILFVIANKDYDPYSRARDLTIKETLKSKHVTFETFKDHVVFEGNEILNKSGNPFKVFTPYCKEWRRRLGVEGLQILDKQDTHTSESFIQVSKQESLIDLESLGFVEQDIDYVLQFSNVSEIVENYDKNRDIPAISTTELGVHLRFGTISIRKLLRRYLNANDVFINQLIWREFFQMLLFHYPETVHANFKPNYDNVLWLNDETAFEAWKEGRTGIPIVDAGMRELNQTGLMHNRVRMITASFLIKNLLIDWRFGEAYFAEKLLDYEQASNVGSWQWVAGTGCDAAPYFRVFNPITQQEKFDPDFKYVKKWVPELGTKDYPEPIVDLKSTRLRAIETYKKAVS